MACPKCGSKSFSRSFHSAGSEPPKGYYEYKNNLAFTEPLENWFGARMVRDGLLSVCDGCGWGRWEKTVDATPQFGDLEGPKATIDDWKKLSRKYRGELLEIYKIIKPVRGSSDKSRLMWYKMARWHILAKLNEMFMYWELPLVEDEEVDDGCQD